MAEHDPPPHAEQDGTEAYVAGATIEENPFVPGTPDHAAWLRGWLEAEARHVR